MAPVHFLPERVKITADGTLWVPHVLGEQRQDGMWEAWIEFHPEDGRPIRVTERESSQPNRTAVEYWATGLEPVYYEGAFLRASEPSLSSRH